jgi:hypothetical protein
MGALIGDGGGGEGPVVVNLEPNTLEEVVGTFALIAEQCGVPERGAALTAVFRAEMAALTHAVAGTTTTSTTTTTAATAAATVATDSINDNPLIANVQVGASALTATGPTVLLLEWLDPPFDGGHWVPDLIRAAGCVIVSCEIVFGSRLQFDHMPVGTVGPAYVLSNTMRLTPPPPPPSDRACLQHCVAELMVADRLDGFPPLPGLLVHLYTAEGVYQL